MAFLLPRDPLTPKSMPAGTLQAHIASGSRVVRAADIAAWAEAEGVDKADLPQIMQNNLTELNSLLAAYERVSEIIIYPTEFEKTPKRSIKRYLYSPSLLNK